MRITDIDGAIRSHRVQEHRAATVRACVYATGCAALLLGLVWLAYS